MAEPPPDIHELFRHYNALYFDDALAACNVTWAPRMRSSIGICRLTEVGRCEIRLSEPLLKLRSSSDVKNSLLHEMVHASLWIKEKNKNRSKHGANFWAIANEINSSCKDDDQRPSNGYNISDQHKFYDEAEISTAHQWKLTLQCVHCGILTKTESGRAPLSSGRLQKTSHEGDCSNLSCEGHRHKKLCSGRYNKVNNSSFNGKRKTVEGAQVNDGSKHPYSSHPTRRTRRIQPAEEIKDKNKIRRLKKLTNFCSSVGDKPKTSKNILKYQRRTCKKKCDHGGSIEKTRSCRRKREISLSIPWLGVHTDEESEEEEEPLINKRSLKRMKLKLKLKETEERGRLIEVIYVD